IYTNFLKFLDPAKRYLTEEDIAQLEQFRLSVDDEIKASSFEFLNLSATLISSAIQKCESYYRERIEEDFDIYSDAEIVLNADKRGYATNDEAQRDFWRRLLQYEIMTKVNDKIESLAEDEERPGDAEMIEDARKKVKKNFDQWFERLSDLRRSDRFEDYLNAITITFDPHTNYFSPKEKQDFDLSLNGSYEGIGARLLPDGELIRVTEVIAGGPAWKGKQLEENDMIMKVAQDGEEPKDVRGWRVDDVILLIRGKKGTKVILTVKKADGSIADIPIVRDQIVMEEGKAKSLILGLEEQEHEIGYIKLPKFYFEQRGLPGCAEDVETEIEKMANEGVKGIILDLRNNGGGSLAEVVEMSGLFFEKGPVVQVKSRDRRPYVLKDEDPGVKYNGPVVVMVNHFSASASEIISAALQDYDRAIIVGSSSTFGKGTVQRFHELDRFVVGNDELKPLGEVKITTQKFYRVNGGSTQLKGVVPDIVLPSTYNYVKVGEREYDDALAWTEIEAVDHQQSVASVPAIGSLAAKSAERVTEHPTFGLIEERAEMMQEQEQDEMRFVINLDEYQNYLKEKKEKNARYKKMFKPISHLTARNATQDLEAIEGDEKKKANNDDFIKAIKKDVYVEEVLQILADWIQIS
ncbi:MAG: carboxy terminal-processing peptidase, partial [Saprospiraceae bacterium]|nr:carboxy terminal-processing peptidase [Saprospiraceae bacterium]